MRVMTCPKCGGKKIKKEEGLMDRKLGIKIGPIVPKRLSSHVFEIHICKECGYVVELYHRGTTWRPTYWI